MSNLFLPPKVDISTQHTLTAGTYTWTAPSNPSGDFEVILTLWGAGGGAASGASTYNAGGGGGGGGYYQVPVTVKAGESYTINVGAGGSGGAARQGSLSTKYNGYAGVAGGVTRMTYSTGYCTVGGGSGATAPVNGTGTPSSGGSGGTLSTSSVTNFTVGSYLFDHGGGNGGNGGVRYCSSGQPVEYAPSGTIPTGGLGTAGAGGHMGSNTYPAAGGGGAGGYLSLSDGGNGGNGDPAYPSECCTAGGGGGSGYLSGTVGSNQAGIQYNGAAGGNGGNGRFIMEYVLESGTSDNAPI